MAPCGGGASLRRRLSPEEQELWRRIQRSVKPLHERIAAEPDGLVRLPKVAPTTASKPPLSSAPPAPAPTVAPAKPPAPTAPADRGGERRVRRGKLEISAKLDLHGYSQEKARAALGVFLQHSAEEGARVVLVVTGRGMRPGADGERKPGVLRQRLPEWLAEPALRPLISGYAVAHATHGGEGAYYVFLRRPRED